jgi:sporulation protein YqfC
VGFRESINGFFALCNVGNAPYRITALGNSCALIEGVKKILELSPEKISLLVKGGRVVFYGESLNLSSCVEKDVTVVGKIIKTEFIV